ncbi:NAD-dependent epimerase/dehydratase family protein [Sneathiella sp.]|uniref:NAD-dependent epimerase/dehydratase family protein n=1 Tax=Sneathiella sp. TaxID=1964365 RepID=UPI002FE12ED5
MTILVTGAAGFIGMHVAEALLADGRRVVGVDNLNPYYDVTLKEARLARLLLYKNFTFYNCDIADRPALFAALGGHPQISLIVHLAAQAGVRHSLNRPFDYTHANITGFLCILEAARQMANLKHLVYASSSSVYGANSQLPYSVASMTDSPVSLYAATKKANELMAYSYSHLYDIPMTGLRFFTVYGPWGRPDMAYWRFTEKILRREALEIYNHGDMQRDFTYIDDVVKGVLAVLASPPEKKGEAAAHRVYNIGNNRAEKLLDLVAIIEKTLGVTAERRLLPMQPGDIRATFADIKAIRRDIGFEPSTRLADGLPKFVNWYRSYIKG